MVLGEEVFVLGYCQNHETSGNILVPLLVQEQLLKWQYIAFFRAYLDTILKALLTAASSETPVRFLESFNTLFHKNKKNRIYFFAPK